MSKLFNKKENLIEDMYESLETENQQKERIKNLNKLKK